MYVQFHTQFHLWCFTLVKCLIAQLTIARLAYFTFTTSLQHQNFGTWWSTLPSFFFTTWPNVPTSSLDWAFLRERLVEDWALLTSSLDWAFLTDFTAMLLIMTGSMLVPKSNVRLKTSPPCRELAQHWPAPLLSELGVRCQESSKHIHYSTIKVSMKQS